MTPSLEFLVSPIAALSVGLEGGLQSSSCLPPIVAYHALFVLRTMVGTCFRPFAKAPRYEPTGLLCINQCMEVKPLAEALKKPSE